MSLPPIQLVPEDDTHRAPVGTGFANRISKHTGFKDLSAGFMEFLEDTETDPWTAPYEEIMYVIKGELTLRSDGVEITAKEGEVASVEKGATLTYQAPAGTKLFFSLTPADWQERLAAEGKA